jgi:hypothetical protein
MCLRIRAFRDAVLVPLSVVRGAAAGGAAIPYRVGGFDSGRAVIRETGLWRHYGAAAAPEWAEPAARLPGTHVYGGILLDSFGHFLLESLARLWAIGETGDAPVLWHFVQPRRRPWQSEILGIAGLHTRAAVPIDRPLGVETLLVPDPGFVIGTLFHPRQAKALDLVPAPAPRAGRRVWLSRSALPPHHVRVEGEAVAEEALRARGWRVVHPERLTVRDQLAAIAEAEVVAGFQGSALHSLILLSGFAGEVRIVRRREAGIGLHPNYGLIARGKGFRQRVLAVPLRALDDGGSSPRLALERPEELADLLDGRA